MKLYLIKAYNSSGGGIGNYHVVASGVMEAKKAVNRFDPNAFAAQNRAQNNPKS